MRRALILLAALVASPASAQSLLNGLLLRTTAVVQRSRPCRCSGPPSRGRARSPPRFAGQTAFRQGGS
ncbi:hypothetical protein ACRAWD_28180 [Caulobacter segnis]